MIYNQTICVNCNKDVNGYKIVDKKCPHCDEMLNSVEQNVVINFDEAYYQSCATPKEILGKIADKNTKRMGSLAEELTYNKKMERVKAIKEKYGSSFKPTSGETPFYRPGKSTLSESEMRRIIEQDGFKEPEIKTRPGKGVKVKKCPKK